MSDTIDDFKALGEVIKAERLEAWNNRAEQVAQIEAAGFEVKVVSEESRQLRISLPGKGWFDFWPSTGRWQQSQRKGGKRGIYGHGVERLIEALKVRR